MIPAVRLGRTAAVWAAALTLVAGCAAKRGATPPPDVPVPTLRSVLQVPLPIAAYALTSAQIGVEQLVVQKLRQKCMRGLGFDYLPDLSTAVIRESARINDELESRRYGISDQSAVRQYGYHLPPWTMATGKVNDIGDLSGDAKAVFTGTVTTYRGQSVPAGGCVAQAAKELAQYGIGAAIQQTGGLGADTLVGRIRSDDFDKAQADPRVRAVFARWSNCMRSYGYSYDTPFTAAGDPRWAAVPNASQVEIQTAERDIDCKLQVNLLGVEFATESNYQTADIAANVRALAAVRADLGQEAAGLQRAMAGNRW